MNRKAEQDIRRKLKVLKHAEETGNVSKTCRYWGGPEKLSTVGKRNMKLKENLA